MKRFISVLLAAHTLISLVLGALPTFAAESLFVEPYSDVGASAWYREAALYCFDHGYMKGTAAGVFSPDMKITRAMAVTMLCNMNTDEPYYEAQGFDDVSTDSWYYTSVEWAYYNGVTKGTGNNRFTPNAAITRQDFVTLLYNYYTKYAHDLGADKRDYDPFGYSDITMISEYAETAMDWAIRYRMISGFTDATLRPKALISRAEAAKMLMAYDNCFGHQWDREVVTERSCTVCGEARLVCRVCSEERNVITDAYHLWDKGVLNIAETCTTQGEREYHCINCEEIRIDIVPAAGHSWRAVRTVEPTYTSEGYTEYICIRCDQTKQDDFVAKKSYYDDDGLFTIDEYLGIEDLAGFLSAHVNEFLGTPYHTLEGYVDQPWLLLRDKGTYGKDAMMNCTGFVAAVVRRSGGDLSKLVNWNPGAYANGYNWIRTVEHLGIDCYKFTTVQEALNSGKMQKGDIIFFMPPKGEDCHLGIFWGDTPYQNKIIHSTVPSTYNYSSGVRRSGVQISGISSGTPYTHFYVIPMSRG